MKISNEKILLEYASMERDGMMNAEQGKFEGKKDFYA